MSVPETTPAAVEEQVETVEETKVETTAEPAVETPAPPAAAAPAQAPSITLPEGVLQKDEDAIKLFIGQIPKTFDENTLRPMFEPHGKIFEVKIIRNKQTDAHCGCAFVTYCTRAAAETAKEVLHGKHQLQGCVHPMQVRYAEGQAHLIGEHKLFIGMVPKSVQVEQLEEVFKPFGDIVESTILKDHSGSSKGCGFIKFKQRDSANRAIAALNQQHLMQGGSTPLVVKWADSPQQKEQKNKQTGPPGMMPGMFNPMMYGMNMPYGYNPYAMGMPPMGMPPQGMGPMGGMPPQGMPPQGMPPQGMPPQGMPPQGMPPQQSMGSPAGGRGAPGGMPGNFSGGGRGMSPNMPGMMSGFANPYGMPTGTAGVAAYNPYAPTQARGGSAAGAGLLAGQSGKVSGPDGSNLFIRHLPSEWGDNDLFMNFAPFGTVLSTKVVTDAQTGLSRCFGFVSYDNPQSAQMAVQNLDGLQAGGKRLKVELKAEKNRPY